MPKQAFIFIGRSGCGKGTQAELLIKSLKEIDPTREIFHLESGKRFRELVKGDSYTSHLAKKVNDTGGLQPAFLSIYVWSDILINSLGENDYLILDGVPRREEEALALKKALIYYGYKQVNIIYLEVSPAWSKDRLEERGRSDDDDQKEVDNKMKWFEEKVKPTIDYLKNQGAPFVFRQINGEQTIEEVHQEILKNLSLSK